jgi:hypothetical protein
VSHTFRIDPVPPPPEEPRPVWRRGWTWAIVAVVVMMVSLVAIMGSLLLPSGSTGSSGGPVFVGGQHPQGASGVGQAHRHRRNHDRKGHRSTAGRGRVGLDPRIGVPSRVRVGSSFRLGAFRILPGWAIGYEYAQPGFQLRGLRVKNLSPRKSLIFEVEIKLHRGSRVVSDLKCGAGGRPKPGQISVAICFPTFHGRRFDWASIENSRWAYRH